MPFAARLLATVRTRARHATGRAVHRGWRWVQTRGAVSSASPGPYRFGELGDGSTLAFPTGTIFNESSIRIGPFCIIGERVTLSAGFLPGLDLGPEPVITIGGGCVIGRGSHLVGHQSIVLGDDVWTGPNVYISDQAHEYRDTTLPIGKQWPRNESVEIGSGSWIGTGAVILPGARLGRNVVVAAGSVVRGEIPDYSVVAGAPAKVVRSFSDVDGWQPPFRHAAPTPLPDGITAEQLRALVGWDLRPPTGE
ncbi:acetyltransferase-like isoleucine patch superfamily enzyme [Kitasatospora sp. GP30]|uniref:acyltransferase n=1 Tax=Kitasatospora sp. GP30 TaxID=3035084 RepID=UPI000C70F830|nr:acyltransferase [Kitasatospora sp. GP30]MDH6143864.1 acetyltransferase-like isoleucine patch superfamily enzyme [Kitasatospora sp. GP30]